MCKILGVLVVLWILPALGQDSNEQIQRVRLLFGSCLHQDKPQPIWQAMIEHNPDVLVLLGDNVYGDTEDMKLLASKYEQQWQQPGMQKILAKTALVGIWDDHDYGQNDAGLEYPQKEASRQILLDYFKVPKNSPRRSRPDGIYTSQIIERHGLTIQLILPDLRWNRTPLTSVSQATYLSEKAGQNLGPYLPNLSAEASLLGEKQWRWVEQQFKIPADVRIFASSIQVLPEFSGWESWANFPRERQRLIGLLDKHKVHNLVMVSGDTHWSEMSRITRANGHELWEMTSSGLTEEWKAVSPNKHRVGASYSRANFGVMDIQIEGELVINMAIKDVQGNLKMNQKIRLADF